LQGEWVAQMLILKRKKSQIKKKNRF